ncbi:MAG: phage minor capsid protein [Oscillospiraceae bacterium]
MLKPNEIEKASTMLDEPMRALENQIMEDIVRRIKINGEITRSADWQLHRLYEMGMSKADIKQALKDNLNFDDKDILELYKKVYKAGYSHDEEIYLKKGLMQVPFEDNIPLQQMISAVAEQTANEIKNISQSLGFAVKQLDGTLKFQDVADFYQQTLDNSILGIANGVIDYNTAIKNAVSTMTNSGLRTVDYASGWSNRVYVAGRRAIVTGMSQLTAKVNEDNAKALKTEYFEVTWHSGARPSHQEWQGKVYTKEQLETVCGLGTVTGLCGANCYHDYYPFIPGISERTYTDE